MKWLIWAIGSIALAGFLLFKMFYSDDQSTFIIGEATHGHHQIELACDTCHTDAFGGKEIIHNACLNCHQDELKESQDSHPMKKFNDPRNADLLEVVDARNCVSCHTEHQSEQTHPMGLTLPKDYCFHCHEDVGEERPSHKDLAFDSCASAGCHNYHDNRALYENFLVKHSGKDWTADLAQIAKANAAHHTAERPETAEYSSASKQKQTERADIHKDWLMSSHAKANVGCVSCHESNESPNEWIEKPTLTQCQSCHTEEVKGFTEGKHGMRLSDKLSKELSPMSSALVQDSATKRFHESTNHKELSCSTCHDPHTVDTRKAAVESCLTCHADDHSQAFESSPHGSLWKSFQAGEIEYENVVTCATCHLPRVEVKGEKAPDGSPLFRVEHNQNSVLRPNEKMIRPVCLQCHSLEHSIDSLADEQLIKNNFKGKPSQHIKSVDWALKREKAQ